MRIEIDEEKCTGCGNCVSVCPSSGKVWDIKEKIIPQNLEYCHGCTYCVGNCPQKAINFIRYDEDEESRKWLNMED